MAMPSITDDREQARLCQLREMGAGGLWRDSRRKGKLARGQGAAIEKRRHHRRSRRVSDQRRDLGDDGACNHLGYPTRERRPHIAGAVGAALTKRYFDLGWTERVKRSHAVIVTPRGRRGFQETFGIDGAVLR